MNEDLTVADSSEVITIMSTLEGSVRSKQTCDKKLLTVIASVPAVDGWISQSAGNSSTNKIKLRLLEMAYNSNDQGSNHFLH